MIDRRSLLRGGAAALGTFALSAVLGGDPGLGAPGRWPPATAGPGHHAGAQPAVPARTDRG